MLSPRTGEILNSIVIQYIARAMPVSSQSIINETRLDVSSATVRNEMARLEEENYILRPHTSAGGIPADRGYRYYVENLKDIQLPLAERLMIKHLFHQVEHELEEWLTLAARLVSQSVQDMAIVTLPKPPACRLKHVELVNLHDSLVLLILILRGAKARQQLLNLSRATQQSELYVASGKLNTVYGGLTATEIQAKKMELSPLERQVSDALLKIMKDEDEQEYEEPYLDGLHFVLGQPEFAQSQSLSSLMELVEHKNLLQQILPRQMTDKVVNVSIGKENRAAAIQGYSIVITQYGLPEEAVGNIGVVGPTRMPYARAIATIDYLSSVLSQLVAELYGSPKTEINN